MSAHAFTLPNRNKSQIHSLLGVIITRCVVEIMSQQILQWLTSALFNKHFIMNTNKRSTRIQNGENTCQGMIRSVLHLKAELVISIITTCRRMWSCKSVQTGHVWRAEMPRGHYSIPTQGFIPADFIPAFVNTKSAQCWPLFFCIKGK